MRTKSALAASTWIPIAALALIWALRDVVILIAYAVLLAYALLPAVLAVQRIPLPGRTMSRKLASVMIMAGLALGAFWITAVAIPRLTAEAVRFAAAVPRVASSLLEMLRSEAAQWGLGVDSALDTIRSNAGDWLQRIAAALTNLAGGVFGGMGRVLTFAVVPLLAFYLLADGNAIEASALRFFPHEPRSDFMRLRGAVDRALRSYVRGQAIVCLVMGLAVGIGLGLIKHPAAMVLAVLVGAAEIIPYVGFTIAAVAIALAGWTASPLQALLGVVLYMVVNWAVGTFVTPRVMGRYLEMHPFLVTVSVIAGAQLIGPAGALLALPAAATLQAVVSELAGAPATEMQSSREETSHAA